MPFASVPGIAGEIQFDLGERMSLSGLPSVARLQVVNADLKSPFCGL